MHLIDQNDSKYFSFHKQMVYLFKNKYWKNTK